MSLETIAPLIDDPVIKLPARQPDRLARCRYAGSVHGRWRESRVSCNYGLSLLRPSASSLEPELASFLKVLNLRMATFLNSGVASDGR
jgi:hypothetical protein